MTSQPPKKSSKPPERTTSTSTFKAVEAMRKKLDSIDENTMPMWDEALAAADRALATLPPAPDPEAKDTPVIVVVVEKKEPDE